MDTDGHLSVWRNGAGLLGSNAARKATVFFALLVISRALPPVSFRNYALTLATIELFRSFLAFSSDQLLVQRIATSADEGKWLGAAFFLKGVFATVSIASAAGVAVALRYPPGVILALPLLFPFVLFAGFNESQAAFLQARRLSLRTAQYLGAASVGYLGATVALAMLSPSYSVFLATLTGFEGAAFALQFRRIRELLREPLQVTWEATLILLRNGWPLGLAGILVLAYFRLDVLLLARIRPNDVGLYYASYKLTEAALLLAAAVSGALLPELSRVGTDNAHLAHLVRRAIGPLMSLMLVFVGLLFALGDRISGLLYGSQFAATQPALVALGAAALVMSANMVMTAAIVAKQRQQLLIPLTVFNVTVNILANLLLIPKYGYLGASWSTAMTEFCNWAIQIVILWLILRERPIAARRILPVFVAAAMTVLVLVPLSANLWLQVRIAGIIIAGAIVLPVLQSQRRLLLARINPVHAPVGR